MKNNPQLVTVLLTCLAGLGGSLATGAGAWMAFGRDAVDRGEMSEYVRDQAPWTRERTGILSAIEVNHDMIESLTRDVKLLVKAQQELLVEQRVLVAKFEQALKKEN